MPSTQFGITHLLPIESKRWAGSIVPHRELSTLAPTTPKTMELTRAGEKTNGGETRRLGPAENQLRKISVKYSRDRPGVLRSQLSGFERVGSSVRKGGDGDGGDNLDADVRFDGYDGDNQFDGYNLSSDDIDGQRHRWRRHRWQGPRR